MLKRNIGIDVICFHPLYPEWRLQPTKETLPGVCIYRGGARIKYPHSTLLKRMLLELDFLVHLFMHADKIKRYSHVIAVLPPMLFLSLARICAARDTKVIAIVHDLQGIMAAIGTKRGQRTVVWLVRLLESIVLRFSQQVIVLSNAMATFVSNTYKVPSKKIKVCWPFVSLDSKISRGRLRNLFPGDMKHVVYAGALGEKQNPEGLVSFFIDLTSRRKDLICHFFSRGPIFEALRRNHGKDNCRIMFHDLVPEKDLYELYLNSHVQVIPETIGNSMGAFPSKLPNLLAVGVPILYIGDKNSDVWRVVQMSKFGLCADRWDNKLLNFLADRLLEESETRSHNDRSLIFNKTLKDHFSVDALIKEMIS